MKDGRCRWPEDQLKKSEERAEKAEKERDQLHKELTECTCTDPKEDPYGTICSYCAYHDTLEAFKQQMESKKKLEARLKEAEERLEECIKYVDPDGRLRTSLRREE